MTDTLPSKNDGQRILDVLQEKIGWQSPNLDLRHATGYACVA